MSDSLQEILKICQLHADRLTWSIAYLSKHFPLSASTLDCFDDTELAVLDQFSTRFSKLQDFMGAKLFPAVLELTKEPGSLNAFLDKLYRLEKIGALPSAEQWLKLREIRNAFSHDYPEDAELQAETLNKAMILVNDLLAILVEINKFIEPYILNKLGSGQ